MKVRNCHRYVYRQCFADRKKIELIPVLGTKKTGFNPLEMN